MAGSPEPHKQQPAVHAARLSRGLRMEPQAPRQLAGRGAHTAARCAVPTLDYANRRAVTALAKQRGRQSVLQCSVTSKERSLSHGIDYGRPAAITSSLGPTIQ